jgi:hypothetical protein
MATVCGAHMVAMLSAVEIELHPARTYTPAVVPASKASGHVVTLCLPLPTGSIERNQVGKGGQTL